MRIDGNAVPAQSGTGSELHKPKWFRCGRLDHFPNIKPQVIAHHRHFIDQANVNHPEGVFEQLGHFGHFGRGYRHHSFQGLRIPQSPHFAASWRNTADDLGHIFRGPVFAAGVDAFRREGQEEILAYFKLMRLGQFWQHHFARRPRIGSGLQNDDHASVQIRRQLFCDGQYIGHIRVAVLAQWSRHTDADRVHFLQSGEIGAGAEHPCCNQLSQFI